MRAFVFSAEQDDVTVVVTNAYTAEVPAPILAPAEVVVIEDEDTPLADAAVLGANRGTPSLNADAAVLGEDRRPSTGDESGIWVAGFWVSPTCMAAWLAYTKKK